MNTERKWKSLTALINTIDDWEQDSQCRENKVYYHLHILSEMLIWEDFFETSYFIALLAADSVNVNVA